KREAAALGRYRLAAELQALRHAADHCPHEAGAGPSHALQHPPPVRIYIAFFGHSSLLVAIGVWVMSAISLCDNSSSSRRITGPPSPPATAALSSCTCRSPRRRSSAISGSSSVATRSSAASVPGSSASPIGTNCTPRSSWRDEYLHRAQGARTECRQIGDQYPQIKTGEAHRAPPPLSLNGFSAAV